MRNLMISGLLAIAAFNSPSAVAEEDWVAKSNEHAQVVLEVLAKFSPEGAASIGVEGLDEEISDLGEGIYERGMQASYDLLEELRRREAGEKNRKVRQDLGILIQAVEDNIRTSELQRENMLPYFNMSQTIFYGVRGLIDPQISRERYPAAVTRMEKYAGLVDGYEPITEQAIARTVERFGVEGLIGPYKGQIEQDLERAEQLVEARKNRRPLTYEVNVDTGQRALSFDRYPDRMRMDRSGF